MVQGTYIMHHTAYSILKLILKDIQLLENISAPSYFILIFSI